jgi:uncharacterized membrane protein
MVDFFKKQGNKMTTKKLLLLSMLTLTMTTLRPEGTYATTVTVDTSVQQNKPVAGWKELCKVYVPTIVVGGLVGAVTSGLLRLVEKNYPQVADNQIIYIALMLVELEARTKIVNDMQQDCDEYLIKYKKDLMHLAARIASWIAYLSIR